MIAAQFTNLRFHGPVPYELIHRHWTQHIRNGPLEALGGPTLNGISKEDNLTETLDDRIGSELISLPELLTWRK